MKLIDFDGIFDRKISDYIEKNATKYTEEQWSDVIPRLYEKFGDTELKIVGTTPNLYYKQMDDETLAQTLVRHVKEGVPVSDFLCREMERRGCNDAFCRLLDSDDETILSYAATANGGDPRVLPRYLDMICSDAYGEDLKDALSERVRENADLVKDRLLEMVGAGIQKDYALDLLSRTKARDDKVFQLLLDEFLNNLDDIPMRAGYLAAYGDNRALPYLLKEIEREDLNYIEFQELKYAIEALGGEYTEPRDFSADPYFQQIHGASEQEISSAFSAALGGDGDEKLS